MIKYSKIYEKGRFYLSSSNELYKHIASFLILCFMLTIIQMPVSAASNINQRKSSIKADIGEIPNKPPKTRLELTSKRTKYSTRYLNPDGSFTEEIYLQPQFYKDPVDKKYKKLDNNLKLNTKNNKVENNANEIKTSFDSSAGDNEIAAVEKEGKRLALIPIGAKASKGIVKNNEIIYKEIFENTDVKYTVQGDTVKEDIILNSYTGNNTFTFEVKLSGLEASVSKDGTIIFSDSKDKKVWSFAKPYMTDAKGSFSDAVKLDLRQENGKTYVDVVADKAFLEDVNTQYPLVIDPTIDTIETDKIVRDTFVASSFPNSAYYSNANMYTGYNSYFGATRSLINFYLPALPSGAKISSASFSAYQTSIDGTTASIDLYRATNSWAGTVNWNTQPSMGTTPESTTTNNAANAFWQWDITNLLIDWYNADQANYGFVLRQKNETTSPAKVFSTINYGVNIPKLTVNYRVDALGIEDFWSYTKDGVNPSNGNLVLQQNDFSVPGRGIALGVTRTYNNRNSLVPGIFGYGWYSNIETQIVDAGVGPITLIDGDFSRHIFGQDPDTGGYIPHGGVYLTLTKDIAAADEKKTYTAIQTDGTTIYFNKSGKITEIVDIKENSTKFNYNTSGKLSTINDASGRITTINYGTNGFVSSITDSAGRTISYAYSASGDLIKVTDPASNAVSYVYDGNHNISTITDERGITTTVTYDGTTDRIKTVSRPITIDGAVKNSTTTYSYDTVNTVTAVVDGEGRRIDYSYNPKGNVVQVIENPLDANNKAVTTFEYNNNNELVQVKDANTNKANGTAAYIYTYDDNGNITAVKLPENQAAAYSYDSKNNMSEESDFNNNISEFDYDIENNQTESTDPYTQTSAMRYDEFGNLEYSTQPMSVADNLVINSSFEKDADGDNWPDNWTKEIEPYKTANFTWSTISKFGNKSVAISNPTGFAVAASDKVNYNAGDKYIVSGYVKTIGTTSQAIVKLEFINSLDRAFDSRFAYGLKGEHDWTRIQAFIDSVPAGTVQVRAAVGLNAGSGTAYFDGIQLEKGTVLSAYNLVENSSFERGTVGWENSGNLSANDKVTTEDKHAGANSYKITGETGKNKFIKQRINISGDANTPVTLSGWSKQVGASSNGGNYELKVGINHTDGTIGWGSANNFSKTASGWQHVAAEVKPTKAFNSIDVYYYYYNQTGAAYFDAMRLEAQGSITGSTLDTNKNYVTSVTDPLGNTVSYENDRAGNVTKIKDPMGRDTAFDFNPINLLKSVTDAKGGVTSYEYDGAGNRTKVTDARGNSSSYAYNEFNQVSRITNPLNQVIQFGYDMNGNTTKITFPNGNNISYSYNALNRNDGIYYNGVKKWGFGYDANGNLSYASDSTGKTTSYGYDKNNRLTLITEGSSNKINYGFDDNSNLTSLSITAGSTTVNTGYSYNSLNQLISLSRNSSKVISFVYDERGNIISASRANGTYTAFEYDSANRISSVKNFKAGGELLDSYAYSYDKNGNITSVTTNAGTISYKYDELNQLLEETLLDGTIISYSYDAAGNRTSKTVNKGGNITTTTYTNDSANQLTSVNGKAFSYDANGNLLSNGDKTFVYDVENRLTQVKNSQGIVIASFTYDYEGKRKSMTTSNGTTYFYYSGDKVVYETDANNNVTAEYTWDAQGNPVTMTKNGVTYYYSLNAHGDVTALTDASGNVVAQYSYDAWGNIISQTGTMASNNPYRYAGYRYDEATGLYYLMARYYDANVGRFITRDAFHGYEEVPKSLNLYVYVLNNPGRYLDSTGYDAEDIGRTYKQTPTVRGIAISAGTGAAAGLGGAVGAYKALKIVKSGASRVWSAAKGLVKTNSKLSADALRKIGTQADSSGIRAVKGNASDALKFFRNQVNQSTIKEVKPGVFVGKDSKGITFTYRAASKSGPPTIDVNGIQGLRKIKFLP